MVSILLQTKYKLLTSELLFFYYLFPWQVYHNHYLQEVFNEVTSLSRTAQSILADLNNAIIWTQSVPFLISNFSRLLFKPLKDLSRCTTILIIVVNLMSHNFLRSLTRSWGFINPFAFGDFRSVVQQHDKGNLMVKPYFLFNTKSGLLAGIMWFVFYPKISENFVHLILRDVFLVCANTVWKYCPNFISYILYILHTFLVD